MFRAKKIPVIDEESSLEISEIYVQRQNKEKNIFDNILYNESGKEKNIF